MKNFSLLVFLLISTVFSVRSQENARIIIDIPTDQKPWNNIEWNNSPENFQFAIVTDRTGGHRPGIFLKGIQKLNLLQPEFVMSVGDLIEGYTRDESRLDAEWSEFTGFIDSLEVPFFYVPGNHDITNEVMEEKWKELFGVTYYHFVYQDVLFLCLNSEDNLRGAGRGTIDDEQYEYIKNVLEENQDVKWTLVFLHQPLWIQKDTKRWSDVEKLLEGRNHNVFAGHYHRYWKSSRNNGKYIALATTGGGSDLRGTAYGEFDHVVWVTMTDEGPLLANLLLEGIWDENVVTEELVDLVRNRPFPVRIEPIYLETGNQQNISTEVRIKNDSDYKMEVELKGMINSRYHYSLSGSDFTLEPNTLETYELKIDNFDNLNLINQTPIEINTEVSYMYPERPDVVLKEKLLFAPVQKHFISKSQKKVKLDGKLNEWTGDWYKFSEENFTGKQFDHDGESDINIKFQTSFDEDMLYLAVQIEDNEIVILENESLWNQDALVVGLDARPSHISAYNNGEGRNSEWIGYLSSFKSKDPVYRSDGLPAKIERSVRMEDNQINIELAIPTSYLNKQQNGNWSSFRLGIGYYDVDKTGNERTEHYWYPAWGSEKSVVGEGTFFLK